MKNDKKSAILAAAEELLRGCGNIKDVTTRAIAAKAGVNPALINYYYKNKETLISRAMREIVFGMIPDISPVDSEDPIETLETLLLEFMHNLMSSRQRYNRAIPDMLLQDDIALAHRILPLVREIAGGQLSETDLRMRSYQIINLTLLVAYKCDSVREYCEADFDTPDCCNRFIEKGLKLIFSDIRPING